MRKLAYYVEPCSEIDLALAVIRECAMCFADWIPVDDYLYVVIECCEEDVNYVKSILAPFV